MVAIECHMTDKIFLAYAEKHTSKNGNLTINFAWPNLSAMVMVISPNSPISRATESYKRNRMVMNHMQITGHGTLRRQAQ